MGIVSWVQNRLGGRTAAERRGLAAGNPSAVAAVDVAAGKERNHQQVVPEDLAGDERLWSPTPAPSHLFSIGTLFNDELPEHQQEEEDLPEFSVEEVRKLQDALARLLRARSKKSETAAAAGLDSGLPLDRFLNCPSSLEVDRRAQRDHGGGAAGGSGLSPDTKMILTKAKDLLVDGNSSSSATTTSHIKNKSFKFLLKKMFVCHGGCFRADSELEGPDGINNGEGIFFLQSVLGRKISARPSNSAASRAYFLEGKKAHDDHRRHHRHRGEEENKGEESCKWDRADSEYIVLEI